jgi:hypothetical protein
MADGASEAVVPAVVVSVLDFGARFSASLYSLPPGHQVHIARDPGTAVTMALEELERRRPGSLRDRNTSHG